MQAQPLLVVLAATLAADPNSRLTAELKLAELSLSDSADYGLGLTRIACNEAIDIHLRQISLTYLFQSCAVSLFQLSGEGEKDLSETKGFIRSILHRIDYLNYGNYAAGFSLKKLIKEYWSPFFPTFKGPTAMSAEVKPEIRSLVFSGLNDPVKRIRLVCSNVVAEIAHSDWPDEWPSLMSELLKLVSSSSSSTSSSSSSLGTSSSGSPIGGHTEIDQQRVKDQNSVDGGMRVLSEFVSIDCTEDQLLPISRQMLPILLEILGCPQLHTPSTRARSILITRQCVMTLFTVKEEHPKAVKSAVEEILPTWLNAFVQLLAMDVREDLKEDNWDGLAIRIAIFQTLEVIANSFPSVFRTVLPTVLSLCFHHLEALYPTYQAAFLSSIPTVDVPVSGEEGSNDVSSDLPTLLSAIIELSSQLCRRKGSKPFYSVNKAENIAKGFELAILYGQMTTDDEDNWGADPNAFIADEDDEFVANATVRSAAMDYVEVLLEVFSVSIQQDLEHDDHDGSAINLLLKEFNNLIPTSNVTRKMEANGGWRKLESALNMIGSVSPDLLEYMEEQESKGRTNPTFDFATFFKAFLPAYLNASDLPFLQGRSFVFASKFSKLLTPDLVNGYFNAAVLLLSSVDHEITIPVKVSAVRALNNFFRHANQSIEPSQAAQAITSLLPLLNQASDNTLNLIIEAIGAAVKVAKDAVDEPISFSLFSNLLRTQFERPQDPMLGVSVCEVFSFLAGSTSPSIQHALLHGALPHLSETMKDFRADPFAPSVSAAMDIIDSIFGGAPNPFPKGMFNPIAEVLFEILRTTEDRDTIQSGLHIITMLVRKDVGQLLDWHNVDGRSGLDLVMLEIAKILSPSSESEAGGLFVGDLVLHLLRCAGSAVQPILPELLQALVARLVTAETASFSQSLILPFAYILHIQAQTDDVLTLLESMQVPGMAGPALPVLLIKWCENVDVFQGFWNLKMSTVALTQLYFSSRPSLRQIQVKGDLLLTAANSNTIMTRAKAKSNPDQFPPIPFHAKVLKILLHDLQNTNKVANGVGGAGGVNGADGDDAESDDGDDEWADEGAEFVASGDADVNYLSDLLGQNGDLAKYMNNDDGSDGFADNDDDEDLKDDPVYMLDLHTHLVSFFKHAYESDVNSFRQLADQYLNPSEKELLALVLQSN